MGTGGGWMAGHSVETAPAPLLSFDELRHALRQIGEQRYHHRHPFHLLMHDGKLSRGQLQAWALNRYYYQSVIPIKDAIIISRSNDPLFRRAWRKRIVDHDGDATSEGGIKRWLKLAEATGLDPARVASAREILPATRYAVNEYLNLVRTRPLLEAVASSLTELFSRDLIALRMDKLREHYPWLAGGLDYFESAIFFGHNSMPCTLHMCSRDGHRPVRSGLRSDRGRASGFEQAQTRPRMPLGRPRSSAGCAISGRRHPGSGHGTENSGAVRWRAHVRRTRRGIAAGVLRSRPRSHPRGRLSLSRAIARQTHR